ncbi:hypothetical protein F0U62_09810 [Cystobacter fuscus]|uniref:hypothetical protein n=1 Tax=Cystobacter fuscus TaxID=43 RepID=UPI002B2A4B46|nr:hypothetical protein F0U62_09810 [Cystobacter fuscus]
MSIPLRIQSARNLFEILDAGPVEHQVAVLQAIVRDRDKVMKLGTDGERDLIDVLRDKLDRDPESHLRALTLRALLALPRDGRTWNTVDRFWRESEQTQVLLLLLEVLQQEGFTEQLRAALHNNERPLRAVMVANGFAFCPGLQEQDRVRIAAISDMAVDEPLSKENLEWWVHQLRGPFEQRALRRLDGRPWSEVCLLLEGWESLGADTQKRLLEREWQEEQRATRIGHVLRQGSSPLLPFALQVLLQSQISQLSEDLRTDLLPLVSHPDPGIRSQVLALALKVPQDLVQRLWAHESEDEVRLHLIPHLNSAPLWVDLLHHHDWRFRARAAELLILHGEDVLPLVLPLMGHERSEVRAAAFRVIYALAEDDGA